MEDEEIVCIALLKARRLDSLNFMDLSMLSAFFNLTPKNKHEEGLLELKKTISYIMLI
jgi:hypothetical protein